MSRNTMTVLIYRWHKLLHLIYHKTLRMCLLPCYNFCNEPRREILRFIHLNIYNRWCKPQAVHDTCGYKSMKINFYWKTRIIIFNIRFSWHIMYIIKQFFSIISKVYRWDNCHYLIYFSDYEENNMPFLSWSTSQLTITFTAVLWHWDFIHWASSFSMKTKFWT